MDDNPIIVDSSHDTIPLSPDKSHSDLTSFASSYPPSSSSSYNVNLKPPDCISRTLANLFSPSLFDMAIQQVHSSEETHAPMDPTCNPPTSQIIIPNFYVLYSYIGNCK